MPPTRSIVKDVTALAALAAEFARSLRPGDFVALDGPLGAGKTTFVAAIVRALHGIDAVSSPTFVFWNRYAGAPPIEHLDLYRIESEGEATELGLHEAFTPEGIAFVEWPGRLPNLIPASAIRVSIAGCGDEPRSIEILRS